ncbi:MAG: VTT domain-containing protein [Elusimicrobia bacterium]|nr:VTT domain-containing protein [Elusimicrobiota bacterium]
MSGWSGPGLAWLEAYGTGAVFLACLLESVLVPIPTPPFVMAAGAFLIPQALPWQQAFVPMLLRVAVPGAAGTALGALVIFWLCYWGGKKAIDRYGRYFGVNWKNVIKINARLEGQIEVAVLATRALPLFPISVVSAAAGIMRMGTTSFLVWSFCGAVLRYMMLGYLGWLSKGGYDQAPRHLAHWERWAAGAVVLTVLGVLAWWKRRKPA